MRWGEGAALTVRSGSRYTHVREHTMLSLSLPLSLLTLHVVARSIGAASMTMGVHWVWWQKARGVGKCTRCM